MMENIVLVSHGQMAAGVKATLEMIVGKQDHVHVVSLKPDGDDRQFEADLQAEMKTLNGSTLIIADLLGGTPCNVALRNYLEDDQVAILAGMSLPLVIEATLNTQATPTELVTAAKGAVADVKVEMSATTEDVAETTAAAPTADDLAQYQAYAGNGGTFLHALVRFNRGRSSEKCPSW